MEGNKDATLDLLWFGTCGPWFVFWYLYLPACITCHNRCGVFIASLIVVKKAFPRQAGGRTGGSDVNQACLRFTHAGMCCPWNWAAAAGERYIECTHLLPHWVGVTHDRRHSLQAICWLSIHSHFLPTLTTLTLVICNICTYPGNQGRQRRHLKLLKA